MKKAEPINETYSKAETEARREATLKKLLSTPPKPRKAGRAEARPKDARSRKNDN